MLQRRTLDAPRKNKQNESQWVILDRCRPEATHQSHFFLGTVDGVLHKLIVNESDVEAIIKKNKNC
jgi:hypothetical protein